MKIGMNLMLWTAHPDFAADSQTIDKLSDFGYDAFEMTVGELDGALIAKYAKKSAGKGYDSAGAGSVPRYGGRPDRPRSGYAPRGGGAPESWCA